MSYQCGVCLKDRGHGEAPLRLPTKWKEMTTYGAPVIELNGQKVDGRTKEPLADTVKIIRQIAVEKDHCPDCAVKHHPENPLVKKYVMAQTKARIARLNREQEMLKEIRNKREEKDRQAKREAELLAAIQKKKQETEEAILAGQAAMAQSP